jgi:hypothetical protein
MGEDGGPNGVLTSRVCFTCSASIRYKPVPPMIPIMLLSLYGNCATDPRGGKMPQSTAEQQAGSRGRFFERFN